MKNILKFQYVCVCSNLYSFNISLIPLVCRGSGTILTLNIIDVYCFTAIGPFQHGINIKPILWIATQYMRKTYKHRFQEYCGFLLQTLFLLSVRFYQTWPAHSFGFYCTFDGSAVDLLDINYWSVSSRNFAPWWLQSRMQLPIKCSHALNFLPPYHSLSHLSCCVLFSMMATNIRWIDIFSSCLLLVKFKTN